MSDERSIELLRERAFACFQRNDLDGGIRLLEQALAIDGDLADLHAWLSLALVDRRLLAAGRAEAELALGLDAAQGICHRAMAHVLVAEGKLRDAKASYTTAVELEPEDPHCLIALAGVKRLLDEDDQPELEQALELEPDDPDVLSACSSSHLRKGNIDEAERLARAALEIDPEHGDALVAMGWVLLRRGELDEAREHAAMALRANPADAEALRLLAAYKARKSRFLSLWFRWNMSMATLSERKKVAALLVLFIVYRLTMLIFEDLELELAAQILGYVWLAFVAYTWIGPALFNHMLRRELQQIRLDPNY